MSLPVIGSIVGTVGGILLIRMFTGKKSHPALPRPHASGSWVNSPIFRFIIEILITLAFPSLKKWASTWPARNSSTCSSNRLFRLTRHSLFRPLL